MCRKLSGKVYDIVGIYYTYNNNIEYNLWDVYTGITMECTLKFNQLISIDVVEVMKLSPLNIVKDKIFTILSIDHTDLTSINSLFKIQPPDILNIRPNNSTQIIKKFSSYFDIFDYTYQYTMLVQAMLNNTLLFRDDRVDQLIDMISNINIKINDGTIQSINWMDINRLVVNIHPNIHPIDINIPSRKIILNISESNKQILNRVFPIGCDDTIPDFCGMNQLEVSYIIEYLQSLIENGAVQYMSLQKHAIKYIALC